MRRNVLISTIGALVISMSVNLSTAAETIEDSTSLYSTQSIENDAAYKIADSFVRDYYTAICGKGDSKFLSSIKSKNLIDYLTTKIEWLSSISVDKENIIISTNLLKEDRTQSSIKLYLGVKLSYNYVGSTTTSEFERCIQIVLSDNNVPQILDVIINDNVDDYFRGETDIMSAEYDSSYWANDTLSLITVSNIMNVAETEKANIGVSTELLTTSSSLIGDETKRAASTSSTITAIQRNKIASYALANCDVVSPVSGNSALIPQYFDFSQYNGNYDCTNFTSHCLLAGGAKFNETPNTGWYYRSASNRTPAWSGVRYFYNFISSNTGDGPQAEIKSLTAYCPMNQMTCELGDIIQIDKGKDGSYNHNVVVTGFYSYSSYSNNAMISGRSGSSSGLSKWFDKNVIYIEEYPIATNSSRVIHLTTLG